MPGHARNRGCVHPGRKGSAVKRSVETQVDTGEQNTRSDACRRRLSLRPACATTSNSLSRRVPTAGRGATKGIGQLGVKSSRMRDESTASQIRELRTYTTYFLKRDFRVPGQQSESDARADGHKPAPHRSRDFSGNVREACATTCYGHQGRQHLLSLCDKFGKKR